MGRWFALLAALAAFSNQARSQVAATEAPSAALASLAWMAGCWVGQGRNSEFREHWMRPAGGMMLGMARTIAGGKVVSYESMRIEADATGLPLFIPRPSGKPEATFKMIRSDAGSIVFENPEKDFPQRVMYRLAKEGELHARIEGLRNGKEGGFDFPMKRASCD
jgi:hypothetical protein